MTRPAVWINNFVDKSDVVQQNNIKIDFISKFYIILQLILGLNRYTVLGIKKKYFLLLLYCYNILILLIFFYFNANLYNFSISLIHFCQLLISAGMNILTSKKLHGFYNVLNEFDNEIGCKSKTSEESLYIVAQLMTTVILSVTFFFIPQSSFKLSTLFHLLVIISVHAIELHYQGHLLSLLIPRMNLIETYCKLSLSKNQEEGVADDRCDSSESIRNLPKEKKKEFYAQIYKLPDYYNKLIIVYDYLYEAIKWQMLMLLTTTFIVTLILCFFIWKDIINEAYTTTMFYWNISYLTIEFIPIFVPCVLADRIKANVRRLRELLASKLYDNTLSKWDRSTARSLHALMETRNLSFSLFNMFDINVTLPFKFMALVITYLIIILQFDKAMTPSPSP